MAWAGLAGEGEEPSDALLGTRAGEDVPDVRGERAGPLLAGVPDGGGEVQQQFAGCLRVFKHWGVSHAWQQLDTGAGHGLIGGSQRGAPPLVVGAEDHQQRDAQPGQPVGRLRCPR